MRNQTFTTRRGNTTTFAYGRNQNTVRHTVKGLGKISQGVIVGMMVLGLGMIYVMQGTQATNYDYALSEIETEIAELQSEKEDLAVEQARLTSIAAAENSQVATTMPAGQAGGYVNE